MWHVLYLALLAGCLLGTAPLELFLHVGVYARWRRLLGAVVPVLVVFGGWDLAGAASRTWTYDGAYLVGLRVPGHLPIEEVLFFLVVPTCAVLTFEAVRACRPGWVYGDEEVADDEGVRSQIAGGESDIDHGGAG